ncbi:DUF7351 domain-containing protein [Halovivax gelatinilyticus]|uniref:DUF7351 domain-containing protein n=1 Tax=Halovivax gelatinilyticus TaxID=2961597 RepID=UPI0020CA946F|nr:helix-turn-helix domain-containing protein [Halovivax gelatinilyticus]
MLSDDGGGDRWDVEPAEAFSTLGNETRMDVLWTLWEADGPLSYAELRREVAPEDQGNFGYHLGKLTDHYIAKTEEGYELRLAGEQVVRAILTGSITVSPTLGPVEVDDRCALCGGSVELRYGDEMITVRCTECPGLVYGQVPRGTFMHYEFPPSGLEGRSPTEIVEAAHVLYDAKIIPMMRGICPECAGRVQITVEACDDHTPGEAICTNCNNRDEVWMVLRCEQCQYARLSVLWVVILNHPAAISFLYDHGIDHLVPFRKLSWESSLIAQNVSVDVLERQPYRFSVRLAIDGDELVAVLTEELTIESIDGA